MEKERWQYSMKKSSKQKYRGIPFDKTAGRVLLTFVFVTMIPFLTVETSYAGQIPAQTEPQETEDIPETPDTKWPQGPSIVAESGIVMEVSTGTILYEKNIDEVHYPASITKIMTALLAIENCDLQEMVTVPHEAVYMEDKGSHIALDEGEQITVEHCLYAIMLASANDAAYALAVHIGGTIENFADMMNAKAQELGCRNTHFVNPNGLPNEEHVTTAYDMAQITKAALAYDIFRTVSETTYYEIPPSENQKDLIPMSNHHKMLLNGRYHYEGAFSGKVGYTVAAQNTLVTCAQREGMELICVTMKTQGRQVYVDTASLLDFGFENFQKVNIAENETAYGEVPLEGVEESVAAQIDDEDFVVIPKECGFEELQGQLSCEEATYENPVASLTYVYQGHPVGSTELSLTISKPTTTNRSEAESTKKLSEEETQKTALAGKQQSKKKPSFSWSVVLFALLLAGGAFFYCQYLKICKERRERGICCDRYTGTDRDKR